MQRYRILILSAVTGILLSSAPAGEIGFEEDFALAADREDALKQLVPGTEDSFYYRSLHLQHQGKLQEVDKLLADWIAKFNETPRAKEIRRRQWLLKYRQQPAESLAAIIKDLDLKFSHQKDSVRRETKYPSELDPRRIDTETWLKTYLRTHEHSLSGLTYAGREWLMTRDVRLTPDQRRDLLRHIERPGYTGLVKMIVADLEHKHSGGFGSLKIHNYLTRAQLEELVDAKGDLLNNQNFVRAYMQTLKPNPDVDWRNNPKLRLAHYRRIWKFARRLGPVHNSLKACVLYNWLSFHLQQGNFDKEVKALFMEYIKLPRDMFYVNRDWLKEIEHRRHRVDLNTAYGGVGLSQILRDHELVEAYFQHWFLKEESLKPYLPYVQERYLKQWLAETRILHDIGDTRKYVEMLTPAQYRQLKERVDLEFVPTNKELFAPDEAVSLDVNIKNVKKLIVKVYEINTDSYFRRHHTGVEVDINLEGLVPNAETTFTYDTAPLRQIKRTFSAENAPDLFNRMKKPGVYVVELIGNGKSSRAVIRKGRLRAVSEMTPVGHRLTVLNHAGQVVKNATARIGSHLLESDPNTGHIYVPFSTKPGHTKVILSNGEFSSLDFVQHAGEEYNFQARFYVDREQLVAGEEARLLIRPCLKLNNVPISMSDLKDVQLTVTSKTLDGITSTGKTTGLELSETAETVHKFRVPDRLVELTFKLSASVRVQSQGKDISLSASDSVTLNGIDKTEHIQDILLSRTADGYHLELRGKTGEALPDRLLVVQLKHRYFTEKSTHYFKTDQNGRVLLGKLEGIEQIEAHRGNVVSHTWPIFDAGATYPSTIDVAAGEAVELPYLGDSDRPKRSELMLLEKRDFSYIVDRFDALSIRDGMIVISDLPRGDYELWIKEPMSDMVQIRVVEGKKEADYLINDERWLEQTDRRLPAIREVTTAGDDVVIRLQNVDRFARVHVLANRYWMGESPATLGNLPMPGPNGEWPEPPRSRYVSGRKISDEYRYVLERKYLPHYASLTLQRPSLLLNPWALRDTDAGKIKTTAGEGFADSLAAETAASRKDAGGLFGTGGQAPAYTSLDFLAVNAVAMANLTPDENGVVKIPRKALADKQLVQVVVVTPQQMVYRQIALEETRPIFRDRRMLHNLDPAKHFVQRSLISAVRKGESFTLKNASAAEFEAYDSLAKAYALLGTLSGNQTLGKFDFLTRWNKLEDRQKREKYSEFASHELHFFLYQRDRAFFDKVVKPYLANKKDKTFMDHWLLGDDLEEYLTPWKYHRLNIAERVLLGQRVKGGRERAARHVNDLFELLPRDPQRLEVLFSTALAATAMQLLPDELEGAVPAEKARFFDGKAPAGESARKRLRGIRSGRRDSEAKGKEEYKGYYAKGGEDLRSKFGLAFYRALDATKEWAENNYYHRPIGQQDGRLIEVDGFWNDYARHDGDGPFLSTRLAEAAGTLPEMIFALSVLDLPFQPAEHEIERGENTISFKAGSNLIVYHREIRPTQPTKQRAPVLVRQNFYRHGDRYRHEDGQRLDKFVTEEFLAGQVYGCQLVITNTSSAPQRLEVLLQIPRGAVPVYGAQRTRTLHVNVEPYHTYTHNYLFYFPATGDFPHFPVHVAQEEKLIAFAEPMTFHVVDELSKQDTTSWEYISQHGSEKQVLEFLKNHNVQRLNMERIAWRVNRKTPDSEDPGGFLKKVVDLLRGRHLYSPVLWKYGLKHRIEPIAAEFLRNNESFMSGIGLAIRSPLISVDPVERRWYQHLEYRPLVNARAHRIGQRRQIANPAVLQQYTHLMNVLAYVPKLSDEDLMSVTYYMLLQDRVGEAMKYFGQVEPGKLHTRLQYDYFLAYMDFYADSADKLDSARTMVARYRDYPVERWRKLFATMGEQLAEIEDAAEAKVIDPNDRTEKMGDLASSDVQLDIKSIDAGKVTLAHANLEEVTVNYYPMDIEMLFSRQPFAGKFSGQFSLIKPNASRTVRLKKDGGVSTFELPKQLRNDNVLVEVVGKGVTRTETYYANELAVRLSENFGQLQVSHAETGKPLAKVYVKVYARTSDGKERFYKDGYTDLRGKFDYASLSGGTLGTVRKLSILILSDKHGAVVREVSPPKQ